jgi:nitrite reductase/ring-hydroxylating ferredoxin subunit
VSAEIRVAHVSDLTDGRRVMARVDGRDVFVFERDGRYYAFENVCRHMGGPVGEGILLGKVEAVLDDEKRLLHERFSRNEIHLVCPWHGWEYDIETGECAANRRIRLRRYEAVQRGEDIYVIA